MQYDVRIGFGDFSEYPFEVINLEFRIEAALEENLDAALVYGVFDFPKDFVVGKQIALIVSGHTVERAELAANPTDVRVIEDPPNDVCDGVAGNELLPSCVREVSEKVEVGCAKQREGILGVDALVSEDFVDYRPEIRGAGSGGQGCHVRRESVPKRHSGSE
ncbi:MAG: hypothetical protein AKCLJLPJ_02162 [Fimbriimonadales bacterium]|nr:hypothetical protein [Fimbriimonadales bacterium]